jgi:signal transduction histidine kinase/ligand-binding sensor domain-containing protein
VKVVAALFSRTRTAPENHRPLFVLSLRFIVRRLVCFAVAPIVFASAAPAIKVSRDYLVHAWQTDNGLPQNWVSSIVQTPDGYLWIGTRYGGLARFDGVRFVPFGPQDTRELQDVQVEHLSVDGDGRLWVIMGNESVTAIRQNQFHLYRRPRAAPRLRANRVLRTRLDEILFAGEASYLVKLDLSATTATSANAWEILTPPVAIAPEARTWVTDGDDTAWCITQNQRLARFRDARFDDVDGLPEPVATALAVDGSRHIWVGTPHHVVERVEAQGFVERTPTNRPAPEDIRQIAFSGDGGLWVLEKNRLRKCLDGRWTAEVVSADLLRSIAGKPLELHGDADGNAWLIAEGEGLWHVKADGSASLLTEQTGLPSLAITCWFQDAEKSIWIGTAGGGIARIRESHFHALGQPDGLPGKVVNSVCVDANGDLWAGTMAGALARWRDGRFTPVPLSWPDGNPPTSVTVFPASGGGLWVGSVNHSVMRLTDGTATSPQTPWSTVRVLFGDSRGRLWVGGLVNLYCVDGESVKSFGSAEGFVNSHAIGAMAEDADGAIWIGTGPGDLWKFADGKFTRFTPPAEWPSVRFSAVLPDKNGVVWVGTLGGGLLRFADGRFTRCTRANGLLDDNVSQLLDSHDGHLWAGTYAGIFRAAKTDLENLATGRAERVPFQVYGRFDGLPALECSSGFQPASWRAQDGTLYFSTANGVVAVDPREITANTVPPTVIIEEMLVDGKPRELPSPASARGEHAPATTPLEIGPGRHYVQFRFTGLNFAAPDGVRFRVKLEGKGGEWQSIGRQRVIGYGPLPPGDFTFQVLACNSDGIWNEKGAALKFRVLPYFSETWWFKAVIAVAALAALGLAVALAQRQRYRRRLVQLERQRELERERARIARDLHDDLGTSLTQISMLSALANREQTSPQEAKELVQTVHGRAREMVTALDEIVWAVNPQNDSWSELANYLGYFAEQFFRPTDIRCRLEIPERLPAHPLSAEIRHELFLAFKEAINNVARHSGAKQVRVGVELRPTEGIISIEDDGHGFDPRSVGQGSREGNGLLNMKRRMEQLGGAAEIQSIPGQGTTVTLRVPLADVSAPSRSVPS